MKAYLVILCNENGYKLYGQLFFRVKEGIQKACDDRSEEKELKFHSERATRLLQAMRAKISNNVLRFTGWILHKILTWALRSIRVNVEQIDRIKEISKVTINENNRHIL